ncbi:MAG: NAD(P)-dependent oxidoreductase [Patescibacteria group bacterium]
MKIFWKNKKVLVTGGAGFIGSYIVKELIKKNSEVTIVLSPKTKSEHLERVFGSLMNKISIEKLDLLDFNSFLKATRNQEIVLNFAAKDGGAKFKLEHSTELFRVNTQLVLNLLESCRINKIDRVLIMSSIDVYSKNVKSPIKEEYLYLSDFDESLYGYALSKRFSEIAAKTYYERSGLKVAIARAGNVYGPNDYSAKNKERVIPAFIDKARKNEDITIWGNGLQKIAFLYITDLVSSLLDLVEKYPVGEPVNLVGSEPISLEDLANLIISFSKSKSKVVVGNEGGNKNRIISIVRAKKVIGFSPKVNMKNGIETILNISK